MKPPRRHVAAAKTQGRISGLKSQNKIVFSNDVQALHRVEWVWLVLAAGLNQPPLMFAAGHSDSAVLVYFGTYTRANSRGIYVSKFEPASGRLGPPELAAETRNPSFLARHPTRPLLYAVAETDSFAGQRAGAVSAFRVEATGKLTLLNQRPSGGTGPCHLAVDHTGKCLLVANYGSGSVDALALEDDGRLGDGGMSVQHRGSSTNAQRQTGPHAHFLTATPDNRFAVACDLGLDKVLVYRLDPARAVLAPNDPPGVSVAPGSGPRHLAFHPHGRFVYVLNELACTLDVFDYDPSSGTLKPLQTVRTLPEDFKGENSCAEIQVHPSGKFVYASNRGHNSIAVFSVDRKTGRLAAVEHTPSRGATPRHFLLSPDGRWLIAENQDSNNIAVFGVDPNSGRLHPTGQEMALGAPACALFVESN